MKCWMNIEPEITQRALISIITILPLNPACVYSPVARCDQKLILLSSNVISHPVYFCREGY